MKLKYLIVAILFVTICEAQKIKLSDLQGTWVSGLNDSYYWVIVKNSLIEIGVNNTNDIEMYFDKVGFVDKKSPILLDYYKKERNIKGKIDADTIRMINFDVPENIGIEIMNEQKNEHDYFYYGGTLCGLGIDPEDLPSKVGSRFELINSNVFVYIKVDNLPNEYLLALYNKGKKDKTNYLIKFFNADFKTIQKPKSIIHSSPNKPTKMYLIKGDEVEVLETKNEWVKIRYFGKKTIEGWVRKVEVGK